MYQAAIIHLRVSENAPNLFIVVKDDKAFLLSDINMASINLDFKNSSSSALSHLEYTIHILDSTCQEATESGSQSCRTKEECL